MVSILFKNGVKLELDIQITSVENQQGKIIINWINEKDRVIFLSGEDIIAVVEKNGEKRFPINNPRFN